MGAHVLVTLDTLVRQTEPPFTERILRARVSSKFKLPTQLGVYEGKTDPMDHLDSYKSLMLLQGVGEIVIQKTTLGNDRFIWISRLFVANFMSCRIRQKNASHLFTIHQKEIERLKDYVIRFNQAILEVENPSDKMVIMAMMEGLRPAPLFDSLSKNVLETLSALQNKVDKYISAEELAEAKRRRRGKDDPKRKEPDSRRSEYRDEEQIADLVKNGFLRKYVINRQPPNLPDRRYGDNRPTARDIQVIHGGFGSGGCTSSSIKRHVRNAQGRAEEEVYNLSSPIVEVYPPITFNNDDLRGLHLPHDDALVVAAVISNFNVQRILVDNGISADILFILAFNNMKIGLDKLHPFHTPLVGFGGNTTHLLGWIKLPITLGATKSPFRKTL
ncbi:uncharacterized protein LOC130788974 [Actinidia eriantha]|uniref:uncharacterized protein LOC130788974 n=1 Tax=Actinidia eriantha TaxID=165200 RepID=UPI0025878172|nr:uncharacterized protein LOC130788974 [Actinidia eriantha]